MSNLIIRRLLSRAADTGNYSHDELDMIRYSAQSILGEIEKILILLIVFSLLGKGWIFILLVFVLLSIRINAGGYHSKTYFGCLLFTFFIFSFAILLLPQIPVHQDLVYGIAWVCVVNTAIFAPVSSEQKEAFMKQPHKKKLLACLITVVWLIVIRFLDESIMIPAIYLIIMQNLQLTIAYFIKKEEKICQKV